MLEIQVRVELPGIPDALHDIADALRRVSVNAVGSTAIQEQRTEIPESEVKATRTADESPLNMEAVETVTAQPEPVEPKPVDNTTKPVSYSFDDISRAGADLCTQGKIDDLTALLNNKYHVQAITQIDPSQYAELAADLIERGAKL